jgi:hypothetical protein
MVNALIENMQNGIGNGKQLFDVWMKEESDIIQSCSRYYLLVFYIHYLDVMVNQLSLENS